MASYVLRLDGGDGTRRNVSCDTIDGARNEAVRFLGAYLADHPGFADEGHWRVYVDDDTGRTLLHVIVATVTNGHHGGLAAAVR